MNCYMHQTPGRIRVKVPSLKGETAKTAQLEVLLAAVPGITSAWANPLTGSITVLYNTGALSSEQVLQALRASEFIPANVSFVPFSSPPSAPSLAAPTTAWSNDARVRKTASLLLGVFVEQAVQVAAQAAVAALL